MSHELWHMTHELEIGGFDWMTLHMQKAVIAYVHVFAYLYVYIHMNIYVYILMTAMYVYTIYV